MNNGKTKPNVGDRIKQYEILVSLLQYHRTRPEHIAAIEQDQRCQGCLEYLEDINYLYALIEEQTKNEEKV